MMVVKRILYLWLIFYNFGNNNSSDHYSDNEDWWFCPRLRPAVDLCCTRLLLQRKNFILFANLQLACRDCWPMFYFNTTFLITIVRFKQGRIKVLVGPRCLYLPKELRLYFINFINCWPFFPHLPCMHHD